VSKPYASRFISWYDGRPQLKILSPPLISGGGNFAKMAGKYYTRPDREFIFAFFGMV
jgi:hypothetical protein